MAKRAGKYKLSKRDSEISLRDGGIIDGALQSNYLRFVTGDYKGLSLATKTDANCDSGFTFAANTYHECAALGDQTNAFVLPTAAEDTLVVMKITAQYDGGNNATISTSGTDTFEAQTLNIKTINAADGNINPRVFGTDFTTTQNLGKTTTFLAVDNRITLSTTATNNQTNVGAELSFYCETAGKWRIAFMGSELGSGAMNATFSGSVN
tara:strand:+ start:300 stop:926 length:627 start_codon:yes stop_codon:yes gene_type:complete